MVSRLHRGVEATPQFTHWRLMPELEEVSDEAEEVELGREVVVVQSLYCDG